MRAGSCGLPVPAFSRRFASLLSQLSRGRHYLSPFKPILSFGEFRAIRPSAGQRRGGGSPLPPADARQKASPEPRSMKTAAPSEDESDHCPYQRNFFLSRKHQKRVDRRGFGPSTAAPARPGEPGVPGSAPWIAARSASRFRSRRLLPGGPRYRLCTWKGPQAGFGDSLPRWFRSGWGAWVR